MMSSVSFARTCHLLIHTQDLSSVVEPGVREGSSSRSEVPRTNPQSLSRTIILYVFERMLFVKLICQSYPMNSWVCHCILVDISISLIFCDIMCFSISVVFFPYKMPTDPDNNNNKW